MEASGSVGKAMKLHATFLAAIAALSLISYAGAPGTPKVVVNGKAVAFPNGQPQSINGRIMVPLRGVFEAMNAYVEYDPNLKTVRARRGNEEIELRVGEKVGKKNGAEIMIEVPPVIRRQSTLVPLRFLAEALGGKVDYVSASNTVQITVEGPGLPPQR